MINSFVYQNSDRIEELIEELKQSPKSMVRVPIGKRPVPILNRLLLAMALFCLSFLLLFFPFSFLAFGFLFIVPGSALVSYIILFTTLCALIVALVGYSQYKTRQEYKNCYIEDLSYYDLARMIAFEDSINLDQLEETETPIDSSQIDESSIEGVIYWMERVKGEGEILPDRASYRSLDNSIKYLKGLTRHHSYPVNSSILEGMSKTMQYYDTLVNEEIPTEKVVRVLRNIERTFPEFERVCQELYERSIDNDLLETEVHLEALNNQFELKGLGESDFNIEEETEFKIPMLVKKEGN